MALRIVVDTYSCVGHGRCYSLSPDPLSPDDEGHVVPPTEPVPEGNEQQARLAVESCPEQALRLA